MNVDRLAQTAMIVLGVTFFILALWSQSEGDDSAYSRFSIQSSVWIAASIVYGGAT